MFGKVGRTALALLALMSLSGSSLASWSDDWVDDWVDAGGNVLSTNWAGYFDAGTHFNSVSSTFIVPTATQRNPGQAEFASIWDGIGGITKGTTALVQAGIHIQVEPGGHAAYSAFIEGLNRQGGSLFNAPELAVRPGDRLSVVVTEVGPRLVNYRIADWSTGRRFDKTFEFSGDSSSAEWIVEAPRINGVLATTPNLSPIRFLDTGFNDHLGLLQNRITMVNAHTGAPIYTASMPIRDDGFTVCSGASCAGPGAGNHDSGNHQSDQHGDRR